MLNVLFIVAFLGKPLRKATVDVIKKTLHVYCCEVTLLSCTCTFLIFSLFLYRWHFQPVPTQTRSTCETAWLRGWSSLKCCGLWALFWPWSWLSSSSSPSCSSRSKRLHSLILLCLCVCVELNCSDTCDCRFLLVASGMVMFPLCHLHPAAHRPNCNIQFSSAMGIESNRDWFVFQKILISPQKILAQLAIF